MERPAGPDRAVPARRRPEEVHALVLEALNGSELGEGLTRDIRPRTFIHDSLPGRHIAWARVAPEPH
jgi:hypothetical protein